MRNPLDDLPKTVQSRLKKIKEENEAISKKMKDNTKATVEILKSLIKSVPEVEAVRWSQYTPGFNDGDPCEFSVNELEIKFNTDKLPVNEEFEPEDNNDGFLNSYDVEKYIESQEDVINFKEIAEFEKKIKVFYEVHEILSSNSNTLEETFGNNVRITVTHKGIEKEDYDCGY